MLYRNLSTFKTRLNRGRRILRKHMLDRVLEAERPSGVVQGFESALRSVPDVMSLGSQLAEELT